MFVEIPVAADLDEIVETELDFQWEIVGLAVVVVALHNEEVCEACRGRVAAAAVLDQIPGCVDGGLVVAVDREATLGSCAAAVLQKRRLRAPVGVARAIPRVALVGQAHLQIKEKKEEGENRKMKNGKRTSRLKKGTKKTCRMKHIMHFFKKNRLKVVHGFFGILGDFVLGAEIVKGTQLAVRADAGRAAAADVARGLECDNGRVHRRCVRAGRLGALRKVGRPVPLRKAAITAWQQAIINVYS